MNSKSFNNTKNKISKLWEQTNNIDTLLKQKENILQKYFLENSITLTSKILYDSDWIAVKPSQLSVIRTTILNNQLPVTVLYNAIIDLENFPEIFLPFVQLEVLFKTIPEVYIDAALFYEIRNFGLNYTEVKGDGEVIWKGTVASMSNGHKLTEAQVEAGEVPLSHLKKSWRATLYWTEGGNDYRIVNGGVYDFVLIYDTALSCNPPNNNYKLLEGQMFPLPGESGGIAYRNGIITDLSLTSIDCIGREVVTEWTLPGCFQQVNYTDNVTKNVNWSALDFGSLQLLGTKQRWNGSSWVTDTSGAVYVGDPLGNSAYTVNMALINVGLSSIIEPTQYYHFYSSQKRWLFWISNTTPYNLQNLPATTNIAVVLPYTEITFDLNNADNPPDNITPNLVQTSENEPLIWHKIEDLGNGFGTYRFKSTIRGVGVTQATIPTVQSFDVFNDGYTIVGNTYNKTIISHITKNKTKYSSSLEDVQLRLRLNFQNPFTFFKETRVTHD